MPTGASETGSEQETAADAPSAGDERAGALSRLKADRQRLRAEAARLSDSMADEAEKFADHLERSAARGDRERRIGIAETERRIAGIERRNASRLRGEGDGTPLESLPDLPGFERGDTEAAAGPQS